MSTRRDFLKKAGLITAAITTNALNMDAGIMSPNKSIKNKNISVDDSWDVIIVGGGPAGCTAAISAAREVHAHCLLRLWDSSEVWELLVWFLHGVFFLIAQK